MRLIDADELKKCVLKWLPKDPCGVQEKEMPFETDICVSMLMEIDEQPTIQPEQRWIPCSERLPEDNVPVNITWINKEPVFYYAEIKDVPFTATGVYFKGKWYWYSATVEDYLAEYGRAEWDEIEEAMHNSIEVVAWMPLPEPWEGDAK